jgi:Flp pilus assembly protein TadG
MVESALALMVFGILLAGIMELGLVGLASDTVSFAAGRAARWAAVRGSASGHAATAADIQAVALEYATPLNPDSCTVAVTWTPNDNPGSTVQVRVLYSFSSLRPISAGAMTLQGTARQTIIQ